MNLENKNSLLGTLVLNLENVLEIFKLYILKN
jgi:hypothetical protein